MIRRHPTHSAIRLPDQPIVNRMIVPEVALQLLHSPPLSESTEHFGPFEPPTSFIRTNLGH
jgi:hypothetical protein